jgi:hypothetical protein
VVALLAGLIGAAPARAGDWIQVACTNPNGSAAPSDGWTSSSAGNTFKLGDNSAQCAPGSPMYAVLYAGQPMPVGTEEILQYTPPGGSTLVGGQLGVTMSGWGHNPAGASGVAGAWTPAFVVNDSGDDFFNCAWWNNPGCAANTPDNTSVATPADTTTLTVPPNRGGSLSLAAVCDGYAGDSCDQFVSGQPTAEVQVAWAHLLLQSSAAPAASGFGGSALQPGVQGTGHVVFTATDAGGPGVFAATARLDGRTVWAGVLSSNGGRCVPAGFDRTTGAWMFDWQQPCPASEVVDLPIATAGLPDGSHRLTVTIADAAENISTVLDQTITTSNPTVTPVPRSHRAVRARFVIHWRWSATVTDLISISAAHVPPSARVTVACAGRGCPRLPVRSASAGHLRALLRGLAHRRFRAGERLYLTVSAPGLRSERIAVRMRRGRIPAAWLR